MKDNKLIAEFMGLNIDRGVQSDYMEHELKYDTSWDWLMPVVENIDHLQHEPVVSIEHSLATRSIGDTYKAVVEFIKLYNKKD